MGSKHTIAVPLDPVTVPSVCPPLCPTCETAWVTTAAGKAFVDPICVCDECLDCLCATCLNHSCGPDGGVAAGKDGGAQLAWFLDTDGGVTSSVQVVVDSAEQAVVASGTNGSALAVCLQDDVSLKGLFSNDSLCIHPQQLVSALSDFVSLAVYLSMPDPLATVSLATYETEAMMDFCFATHTDVSCYYFAWAFDPGKPPDTYKEALLCPDIVVWKAAMQRKYNNLESIRAFERTTLPCGHKAIDLC